MSENNDNFEFIKQTRKEKPLNKKKMVIKLVYTICLAIIFGFVASICYTVGLHNFNEIFYPEKVNTVTIIEEEPENETVQIKEEIAEEPIEEDTEAGTVINNIVEKVDISLSDYESLYSNLYDVAKEAAKSIVTVWGVDSDMDWFDNAYENSETGAGLVIANNGKELLILTNRDVVDAAERVNVEFQNGEIAEAEIKREDSNTNLSVISIPLGKISETAMSSIEIASFGSTNVPNIEGRAVIAIGRPFEVNNSVAYGFVTSNSMIQQMKDTDVRLLTTDIYGSQKASGVLINLRGKVLGIITDDYSDDNSENMIKAFSISDIRLLIETMSNDKDRPLLGIIGGNVSDEIKKERNIPNGAYVDEVVMDSPAMISGIQSGDVIVGIDGETIESFDNYKDVIGKKHPGEICRIAIKRFAQGDYKEVSFDITLGNLE